MSVHFYFLAPSPLKERTKLKHFIESIFAKESKPFASLNIIFCSDDYLLGINKQYLQHDYFTDIITFDLAGSPKMPAEGEIYISVDRVAENATKLKVNFSVELRRIIFHGVLHLCGYKDKSGPQKKRMTSKEDEYLSLYSMFHVEHSPRP